MTDPFSQQLETHVCKLNDDDDLALFRNGNNNTDAKTPIFGQAVALTSQHLIQSSPLNQPAEELGPLGGRKSTISPPSSMLPRTHFW